MKTRQNQEKPAKPIKAARVIASEITELFSRNQLRERVQKDEKIFETTYLGDRSGGQKAALVA